MRTRKLNTALLWTVLLIACCVGGMVQDHRVLPVIAFSVIIVFSIVGDVMLVVAKRQPEATEAQLVERAVDRERASKPYFTLAWVAIAAGVLYFLLALHESWGIGPLVGFYFGEAIVLGGAGIWIEARIRARNSHS